MTFKWHTIIKHVQKLCKVSRLDAIRTICIVDEHKITHIDPQIANTTAPDIWNNNYVVRQLQTCHEVLTQLIPSNKLTLKCDFAHSYVHIITNNDTESCIISVTSLTLSVPHFFWLWQKSVYRSVQHHTGLNHPLN